MRTVAEIESAIAQLPPDDFRILHEWMDTRAAGQAVRMWTPDELNEGTKRVLEETDPAKADELWEEVVAGFYGEKRA